MMTKMMLAFATLTACVTEPAEQMNEETDELSAPNQLPIFNAFGASASASSAGQVAFDGPFFAELGTNGRACDDCHSIAAGWSITPAQLQWQFVLTRGLAPVFRPNDGAGSPRMPVSTFAERRAAYAMLLERATIRVGMAMPASAEFELVAVDDPYGYASANELSLFRRPLPSTNLRFQSRVMWDGRESPATRDGLAAALGHQATGATLGHAQAAEAPTAAQLDEIVAFEAALTTAQVFDVSAGWLDVHGAGGGLVALAAQPTVQGPATLFSAWAGEPATSRRAAIARGEVVFNTALDRAGGTCRGCHDVANVGNRLDGRFFNVQVSKATHRAPTQPLYTVRNKTTGELRETTDPGRALVTGLWNDMDRFKVPVLRGLAARPPYFHDGSVGTIEGVVRFYELELGFVLTDAQRADLVAFLGAL